MNQNDKISYLIGDKTVATRTFAPYDELLCEFINDLSAELRSSGELAAYPDIMAFAFWCRKANIAKLKKNFADGKARLGLGLVFHITPSNVPINFAFSFVFGLLSGNANIVRVPSKSFPQIDIICATIDRLFDSDRYNEIKTITAFVRYEQNNEITAMFSANCNARMIWGGDATIRGIRKLPITERCVDIAFSDRYSFCILDALSVIKLDDSALKPLADNFYNDIYLMDQNACSSPHLIVWLGENNVITKAKKRFWDSVYEVTASKYNLQPVNAVDKYMLLCENAIEFNNITSFKKHGNYLYRIELDNLPDNVDAFRGKYGYFFEYNTQNVNSIAHIINTKYQTLTYFGFDKSDLLNFVYKNRLLGIDRIVPVGEALDIGVIWDGYDIVRSLSRIIDIK